MYTASYEGWDSLRTVLDYKASSEHIIMPPTPSYVLQETRSLHSGSVRTETVMYLSRRSSMESLSEVEFAQLSAQFPLPLPNSHVLYHQPSHSSFASSRPGTPSSASPTVYGRALPTLPPAPYSPTTVSFRSGTTADRSTASYSTTNSRAPLQLAAGSQYGDASASPARPSKHLEAEAEAEGRARNKLATFHADSGFRFTAYGEMIPASEPSSPVHPTTPTPAPPSFLQMDPAASAEQDEMEERRRRLKARHVSLAGTAISDVPPMYTEV